MLLSFLAMTAIVACKAKVEAHTDAAEPGHQLKIKDSPLDGKIGGAYWSAKSAFVRADHQDPGSWVLTVTEDKMTDPCNDFDLGSRYVIAQIPAGASRTVLGSSSPIKTATMILKSKDSWTSQVAYEGEIRIDNVDTDPIRGGLVIYYDSANSVSGKFNLQVCP